MNNSKKVLITGGNGFIGSHLVDSLSEKGFSVIIFDNTERKDLPNGSTWFEGDLLNRKHVCEAVQGVDGIIHLAAISRVSEGFNDPLKCVDINIVGTMNVFEAARSFGKCPWIILGSSMEVVWIQKDENRKCFKDVKNMYGLTKLFNEMCCERYANDYSMNVIALRFPTVYGSLRDNQEKVVPKLVRRALLGEKITVKGKNKRMYYIHILDLVDAMNQVIEYISSIGENSYYNDFDLVTGNPITLGELTMTIIKCTKSKSSISYVEAELPEDNRDQYALNGSRSRDLIGFSAKIELEAGISELVRAYG